MFPTIESIAQKRLLRGSPAMTVANAALMMRDSNLSSLIVERGGRQCVFSIEGLLAYLADNGDSSVRLADISLPVLPCVGVNDHVLTALERLEASGQRYLGVDNQGRIQGMLTYTDLLAAVSPSVLIEKKTVGDLIAKSELITFSPDWILEDILCHFKKLEDSVVVVDDGVALGIITTKDVFKCLAGGRSLAAPLSQFMTRPLITTRTSATIQDALAQLKFYNIKRSVVIDEAGALVGVVTQSDLVGFTYGTWTNLTKHHAGELRELFGVLQSASGDENGTVRMLEDRRSFQRKLHDELLRVERYRCAPFALVMFEIDRQSTTVQAGDAAEFQRIIGRLGAELASQVRTVDGVTLWDDRRFAVILPHTDTEAAHSFAFRVKAGIERIAEPGLALSVGVAVRPIASREQLNAFLEGADVC